MNAARELDEFAHDLRQLIVCDTQFGWCGETTLDLMDINRLVERGWLAEGHENAEYHVTDEGRAIIAARLRGGAAQGVPSSDDRVRIEGTVAVTDPHHNGSMEWTWINGRLYSRLRGTSHAWSLCKRVNATPSRLRALVSILPDAAAPTPDAEGEVGRD